MNSERQPLLGQDEHQHILTARPDLRSSPENVLVEVQGEADGIFFSLNPNKNLTLFKFKTKKTKQMILHSLTPLSPTSLQCIENWSIPPRILIR